MKKESSQKSGIRHSFWVLRTKINDESREGFWILKRKFRRARRKIAPDSGKNTSSGKKSYTFALLCVKRIEYADLIIRQANSLHYFNPEHIFVIYTDSICEAGLRKKLHGADYPGKIFVKNSFCDGTLPWQYYKMEMIIECSHLGQIAIDADMIWHDDLNLDQSAPMMFAPAFIFKDNAAQAAVITDLMKKPSWLDFTHFVSAFVSIPPQFMTRELAQDMQKYLAMIFENPLNFLDNEVERIEIKRTSEEIAICFALQSHYGNTVLSLKENGDKKNKKLLEPIYYGCENRILA